MKKSSIYCIPSVIMIKWIRIHHAIFMCRILPQCLSDTWVERLTSQTLTLTVVALLVGVAAYLHCPHSRIGCSVYLNMCFCQASFPKKVSVSLSGDGRMHCVPHHLSMVWYVLSHHCFPSRLVSLWCEFHILSSICGSTSRKPLYLPSFGYLQFPS